ncbi:TTLL3 monoglycylase, partial [Pycnonotus jocosus]|nr:TTLL3 monoglycylase [Pycnonotus jocosus]
VQEKKIFTVQGPYPIIRRELRARGWVERKLPSVGRQLVQHHNPLHYPWLSTEEEEQCDEDPNGIHNLMSYLVRDRLPNFIWTNFLEATDCELLQQDNVVNHYARVDAFTTKEGLCLSLQKLPWIEQADPNTFFPRCYRLGIMDEREAFIEDFRLTAARSLLKLALEEAGDRPVRTRQVPNLAKGAGWHKGHVSYPKCSTARPGSPLYPELVEEALEVCKQHLGVLRHQDIDRRTPSPCRTCIDWDRFLQQYYRVAHEGAGLVLTKQQQKECQNLLQHLAEQLPQLEMEGKLNVWILKPGAESQGRGIICMTRLEEVLQLAWSCTAPSVQVGRWVVQKYVERLLTIFGTKFDIRQWFVVTDWKPLTVWFYQDCYLRFCSRPFSLCHLERARHLCNVSVQKWYKTSPDQDPRVPRDKIWSNKQFQEYLAQLGQADAWPQVLVPGMKAAILSALRSAQDQVRFRKGSFELYGADFLVGEDFQPWLLEINSCPTMSPSSAVTQQLCANVQRDTLCLVLDRKDNSTSSIGAFELIYKE